jgi:hypothetical protein
VVLKGVDREVYCHFLPHNVLWMSFFVRYLKGAQDRLNRWLHGLDLTIEDIYTMQQMCAYEVCSVSQTVIKQLIVICLQTVAIGYSKFCEVFTQEEWEGFNYA